MRVRFLGLMVRPAIRGTHSFYERKVEYPGKLEAKIYTPSRKVGGGLHPGTNCVNHWT